MYVHFAILPLDGRTVIVTMLGGGLYLAVDVFLTDMMMILLYCHCQISDILERKIHDFPAIC